MDVREGYTQLPLPSFIAESQLCLPEERHPGQERDSESDSDCEPVGSWYTPSDSGIDEEPELVQPLHEGPEMVNPSAQQWSTPPEPTIQAYDEQQGGFTDEEGDDDKATTILRQRPRGNLAATKKTLNALYEGEPVTLPLQAPN